MYISKIKQTEESRHFQCGDCEFLATALHEQFGYDVVYLVAVWNETQYSTTEELLSMNPDQWDDHEYLTEECKGVDEIDLIHSFAKTTIGGKDYYIDSTGITNDITDIYKNFMISKEEAAKEPYVLLVTSKPEEYQDKYWSTWRDHDFDYKTGELIGPEKRHEWAVIFVKAHSKGLNVKRQLRKMQERDDPF